MVGLMECEMEEETRRQVQEGELSLGDLRRWSELSGSPHLVWLHSRLTQVYGENPDAGCVRELKEITDAAPDPLDVASAVAAVHCAMMSGHIQATRWREEAARLKRICHAGLIGFGLQAVAIGILAWVLSGG